jgi:Bacterial SH3 domain
MTSVGLDDLKKLINEAALTRIELKKTVFESEGALNRKQRRLRLAQWFIVRLFTKRAVPRLVEKVHAAELTLASVQQRLAGCSVEINFAFDQPTLNAFAAFVRCFEALSKSQKIWDVTASVLANRFVERTIANQHVTRKPVTLGISRSEIIVTDHNALCLTNANGNDIYVYPGFVMIPSLSKDFALIDVRELQVKFSQMSFIEEEGVPSDSEVIGETWKKTNKDGSRDRRFAGNYQIPIAKYAEIEFRSASGLYEVYQFSNFAAAVAFNQSLIEYQNAMTTLAGSSNDNPSLMPLLVPFQEEPEDTELDPEAPTASPRALAVTRQFLVFDWLALGALVGALGGTGIYLKSHGEEIMAAIQPPLQSPAQVAPVTSPIVPPVAANVPIPAARPFAASTVPPLAPKPPLVATPSPPVVKPPGIVLAAPNAAPAPSTREIVYVLKPSVNIRSEPSAVSQILGAAKAGRKFGVFQRQSEWVQLGEREPIGWVHQSLVSIPRQSRGL